MSASQDKKRRQAEREAGNSPKTLAEREAAVKARKERRSWTIVGVILAVFVVVIVLLNTNLLYTGTTAMTIGDYKFTNAQYQYYYNTTINNLYASVGNYASFIGLDFQKDMDDQPLNVDLVEGVQIDVPDSVAEMSDPTWADYIRAVTLDNMVQVTALWDAAVKAGYTLSEDDAETIESTIDNYAALAESNSLRGADGYIAFAYGKGVDSDTVRELLERAYIAEDYSNDIFYGFEYTREELDAYYDENADAFDSFTLDYYFVAAEKEEVTETVTDEETGEETEETNEKVTEATMAEAEELADEIYALVEGGTDFSEAVTEVMGEDAEITDLLDVLGIAVSNGGFPDDMEDWIFDADRAEGDLTVIESENSGYYVLVFHGRSDNSSYNAVNFRHILIKAVDEDEDGEFSDEEIEAAEDELKTVRDNWLEGDADEKSFANLANTYSDDSGSNGSSIYGRSGGLYEHVGINQMVPEVNDWIFDPAREYGDYEIVFVEADSYTGYHLLYFVDTDEISYHDCLAELGAGENYANSPEGLRRPDYEAWETDLVSGVTVEVNGFVNWFAKV